MEPRAGGRPFYGWYIAAIGFAANFMAGGTHFYVFNAFMEPLCRQNGWSRTEVNLALVLGTLFGLAGQLVFGTLVMRTGPRPLMLGGSLVSGAAFILLGRVESLGWFYLLFMVVFFSDMAYGGIVANAAVSNWFVRRRGRALGLSTMGMSLSGVVLPFVAMFLVQKVSLASAFLVIGLAALAVGPAAWLVVRDWPERYGLRPDGADSAGPVDTAAGATTGAGDRPEDLVRWTPRRMAGTGAFWKMGLAYSLALVGSAAVMSQLKPRFVDLGYGDLAAMTMMALTALAGAVGKVFWGWLCDRWDSRRAAAAMMIEVGLGLALALIPDSKWALGLFIPLFGMGMGGIMSTYPILAADLFGRLSFPAVFRFLYLFTGLQSAGYLAVGLSYDRLGSYDPAYLFFVLL
ncbi:MAG: MFS transporter, partial [Thermodesulfobacteriota bacterium]